jgi:L-malate glycosyltransferase
VINTERDYNYGEKNMHVLVIPSWYPTTKTPLNGIFFKEQAKALCENGVNVGLIYPEIRGLSGICIKDFLNNHFQMQQISEDKVKTLRLHSWNLFPKISRLQASQWVYEGKKLARKYIELNGKPDIIHAHSALWGGYVARYISNYYDIPYVITEHSSSYARKLINAWEIPYVKKIFKNSSEIVAVSTAFAHILKEYTNCKDVMVIPNSIDTNYFFLKQKNNDDKFVFLFTAFLTKNKGTDILIKAFEKAFKHNENVVLKIGGDGEQKKELQQLVKQLKLNNRVEFLGMLSREEVRKYLLSCNAFVLPSYYETFGVVLIEALSTGTPVISTKCGGPEDIVIKEVGILVEKGNINELSNALQNMYESNNEYDMDGIRNYVIKKYSNSAVSKKLINIYEEILNS